MAVRSQLIEFLQAIGSALVYDSQNFDFNLSTDGIMKWKEPT
jgi:hypothetical protein